MKAILIDTVKRQVRQVDMDNGIQAIYDLLGCSCFDTIFIDRNNCIYVDDEGLFKRKQNSVFFQYGELSTPIIGNGLIKGCDLDTGDDVDTTMNVEDVRAKVRFMTFPGNDN